jgi:excisionase family DNA binding protein
MSTVAVKNLLSVKEAAEVIGCTDGRICQLCRAGDLRAEKINERAWVIYRESAEAYARIVQPSGRPRVSA